MSLDYKKIIRSRSARLKILRILSFVPDKTMVKIQYKIKTGNRLNLKHPKRFTEKLQWYKLYYRNPLMIQCVDKYDVREYVKSKGLENILIPCYGVYDSIDEVDWDALPNQFVMKDTLGGGGTSVIIVKDKSKTSIKELKSRAAAWTSIDAHRKDAGREWPYYSGKNHRIIFEKYIESDAEQGGLIDYKLFCFNDKVECIVVDVERYIDHKRSFFDAQWNNLHVTSDCKAVDRKVPMPENFEAMKRIAEKLSEDFPFVRVDLYNINGKFYFGELTFYPWCGYVQYTPDSFDFMLGNKFILPN